MTPITQREENISPSALALLGEIFSPLHNIRKNILPATRAAV